ncbi:MAG: DUF6554 family protein [Prochlorococcaceae cyanobacterium]|jgi:hypothetical protein
MAARHGLLVAPLLLALGTTLAGPLRAQVTTQEVGEKGAEVYCFMRQAGNPHVVSWDAAYARIKRQSSNLFKTSPEHAAVLITETVVTQKDKFPGCGRYLGSLYQGNEVSAPAAGEAPSPGGGATPIQGRYSY